MCLIAMSDQLTRLIVIVICLYVFTVNCEEKRKCEEITVPMCRGLAYNQTSMPNQFSHEKQEDAGLEVHQYWPLVEMKCSPDLRFFLCSVYTPICIDNYEEPLPPCQSVCERAKYGCLRVMQSHQFNWPPHLNCDNFPLYGSEDQLCMDNRNGELPTTTQMSLTDYDRLSPDGNSLINTKNSKTLTGLDKLESNNDRQRYDCRCKCHQPLININETNHIYFNQLQFGDVTNCAQSCSGVFVNEKDKSLANKVLFIFASTCFLCSFLVVFTFFANTSRFKYPERAAISLSGCYMMVSLGFLIHYFLDSSQISCDGSIIRYSISSPGSKYCVLVFILLYYFSMAASIWWVTLTLTWFLSTEFHWGWEALSQYSLYFHLIAWIVPGVMSFLAVASGAISGEPLAGICQIGTQNMIDLLSYIIAPQSISLVIGFILLCAGFISFFRLRNFFRQQTRSRSQKPKHKKQVIRILLLSVSYIVPTVIIIICNWYEYNNRYQWELEYTCQHCNLPSSYTDSLAYKSGNSLSQYHHPTIPESPFFVLYMTRYIMQLFIGIVTCFWIISVKTYESWCKCLKKIFCCRMRSSLNANNHSMARTGRYSGPKTYNYT